MVERVSIARCPTYTYPQVLAGVRDAVKPLGGMGAFVGRGDRVLLKPNLLSAKHPDKCVTTHPSVVKAAAQLVQEEGGIPFIGDSPSVGSFRRLAGQTGMKEVANEVGCPLVEFEEVAQIRTGEDYTFRRFELARAVLEADVVISLPKVKTHTMMLFTLGVKNIFGCIPGMRKAQWHLKAGRDHRYFASMLVEICQIVKPGLTIADGIIAMEGDGPGSGDPRPLGLILAGANPLALDTIICQILGVAPEQLPTIQAARRKGLEGTEPEKIAVLGLRVEEVKAEGFRLPRRFDLEWGLPGFVKETLREVFVPKPVVERDSCKGCGVCAEICPPKAISLSDMGVRIDYKKCIRCYCCQEICPEGAVQINEGWLRRFVP